MKAARCPSLTRQIWGRITVSRGRHARVDVLEAVGGPTCGSRTSAGLLDGDEVVATFIISPNDGVDVDERMQECQEYAELCGFRLAEMQAPVVRTVREAR